MIYESPARRFIIVLPMLNTEIKAGSNAFVNGTSDGGACPKYWVAALVQMNTERSVSNKLSSLGIENYIPVQPELRQWSDRKKIVERVVIPMIVFVRVDEETEKKLKTFSFIYKLISYPGQKTVAVIPDSQIDDLKFMLGNTELKVTVSETVLMTGDRVEIIRGPLKGLHGNVFILEGNNKMVGIHIGLLGYAYVKLDIKDVKTVTLINE